MVCDLEIIHLNTDISIFSKCVLDEAFKQLIAAASKYQRSTDILDTLVLCHHVLFLFLSTGVS
jgi:hypothetical protein